MSEQDKVQRSVLPIPDLQHVGLTTYDAKNPDTKFPPIRELRPPAGAPNVLIIGIIRHRPVADSRSSCGNGTVVHRVSPPLGR
jgi:hypothetical protein